MAQEASDVAAKSVGEKASPFPLLSTGASVIISFPERMCVASVRRFPEYLIVDVAILRR
jgi:hypothetical protein